jgi:iron transport multicopper oxidase
MMRSITRSRYVSLNLIGKIDVDPSMFGIPSDIKLDLESSIIYNPASPFAKDEGAPPMKDDLYDMDLNPLVPVTEFSPVQQSVTLNADFAVFTDGKNHGHFNETGFTLPTSTPTLFSAQSMTDSLKRDKLQYGTARAIILDHMNVVELVIFNFDTGSHPFHLHGHVFQIIARGPIQDIYPVYGSVDANPVRRDTVQIPTEEYVVLRFVADNPGTWLMHCHIEWHLESGLAVTFIEAPELIQPPSNDTQEIFRKQCEAGGRAWSGNVMGRQDGDMSGYVWGATMIEMGLTGKGWAGVGACVVSAVVGAAGVIWYAGSEIGGVV